MNKLTYFVNHPAVTVEMIKFIDQTFDIYDNNRYGYKHNALNNNETWSGQELVVKLLTEGYENC